VPTSEAVVGIVPDGGALLVWPPDFERYCFVGPFFAVDGATRWSFSFEDRPERIADGLLRRLRGAANVIRG
jgi:hypothetical protein